MSPQGTKTIEAKKAPDDVIAILRRGGPFCFVSSACHDPNTHAATSSMELVNLEVNLPFYHLQIDKC
jgi:hypothetical protein